MLNIQFYHESFFDVFAKSYSFGLCWNGILLSWKSTTLRDGYKSKCWNANVFMGKHSSVKFR